jgi:hypothetical protein
MDGKVEDKFLDRIVVVGIPHVQSSSNFFFNAVLNVRVVPKYLNSSVL